MNHLHIILFLDSFPLILLQVDTECFLRIIVIHKGRILVFTLVDFFLWVKLVGHNLLLNLVHALFHWIEHVL